MQTRAKHYWVKTAAVTLVSFVVGVAGYVAIGILSARGELNASGVGGWQQVTVAPQLGNLVVEYTPETPLAGSGTASSPYVTYNSGITIRVAMVGSGVLTIEDKYNNTLFKYEKVLARTRALSESEYEKFTADVELVGGVGRHELTVRLNGASALAPNVQETMHIDYRVVPLAEGEVVAPEVPNTGGLRYLYVAGYALPTCDMVWSGLVLATLVFGVFVVTAIAERKKQKILARKSLATHKKISRGISGRTLAKTGVKNRKNR